MPRIFISYRRTQPRSARVLYRHLVTRLGEEEVFLDLDGIHAAEKFREKIFHTIDDCDLLVLMITPATFTELNEDGQRRIDSPEDWVRQEILHAMRRKVPVVPVLLNGAKPLSGKQLPRKLKTLADIQAINSHNRSLSSVCEQIVDGLPKLRIEFELRATKPVASPDYVIEFRVENAPRWAKWVHYRLDDEDNAKPSRLTKIAESDWTTTYGDYEIEATLLNRPPRQKPRRRPNPPTLISNALRRFYGRKNAAIQRAIREISKN